MAVFEREVVFFWKKMPIRRRLYFQLELHQIDLVLWCAEMAETTVWWLSYNKDIIWRISLAFGSLWGDPLNSLFCVFIPTAPRILLIGRPPYDLAYIEATLSSRKDFHFRVRSLHWFALLGLHFFDENFSATLLASLSNTAANYHSRKYLFFRCIFFNLIHFRYFSKICSSTSGANTPLDFCGLCRRYAQQPVVQFARYIWKLKSWFRKKILSWYSISPQSLFVFHYIQR